MASTKADLTSEDKSRVARLSPFQITTLIAGLCVACFVVALDTSIIATAIPRITTQFDSLQDVGWYGSAYVVTLTAFQPSYGKLYTYFDTKWIYLATILLFEVGSTVCAAAPSSWSFIVGRAISGVGAAGVLQGSLATINVVMPLEKRPIYTALVGSMFGLSACAGPILGGALTDKLSWRWCFWINLPIGAVSILCNVFFFRSGEDTANKRLPLRQKLQQLDYIGGALVIAAVVCLELAFQWAGTSYAWKSPRIVGLLVTAGVLFVVFGAVQIWLGELGTIPPRIVKDRTLIGAFGFYFCKQFVLYCHTYYLPIYYQSVRGVSATTSGVRIIPYLVPFIVATMVVGGVVAKTGHYYSFIFLSGAVGAVGSGLLYTLGTDSNAAKWAGYSAITGVGVGIGQQLPLNLIPVVMRKEDTAVGNAVCLFIGQLGGAIALAIENTVFINVFVDELPHHTTGFDPQIVAHSGLTNLRNLVPAGQLAGTLYSCLLAVRRAFIPPIAVVCAGALFGLLMRPINLNTYGKKKETEAAVLTDTPDAMDDPVYHKHPGEKVAVVEKAQSG